MKVLIENSKRANDFQKEVLVLKKETQEENYERNIEFKTRMQQDLARQIVESNDRVQRIQSEKKRIRLACESFRNQQRGYYTTGNVSHFSQIASPSKTWKPEL